MTIDSTRSANGAAVPDPFEKSRRRMVDRQLQRRGLQDSRVLEAMQSVPRHEFVPPEFIDEAYEDWPLPIGHLQTISQPYTVAYMLQLLELHGQERVLEIGTGCGYAAAVLSQLVAEVHTIERIPELGREAQERLCRLGFSNVTVHVGDGSLGLAKFAPYDAIVATAGGIELPQPLADQLAEGGRIVIPLGPAIQRQTLYRFRKQDGRLIPETHGAFAFVPLVGQYAWDESAGR